MPIDPSDFKAPTIYDADSSDAAPQISDTPPPAAQRPDLKKLVAFTADHFGVDQHVLAGMLMKESALNDDVISGKRKSTAGAVGIAQFMPDTAKRFGIDATDATQSVLAMGAYLRDNLKKFDGDYERAIAGYNWGENRKALTGPDWKAALPAETADYVDFVTQFAHAARTEKQGTATRGELPPGVKPGVGAGAGRGLVNPPLAADMPRNEPGTLAQIGSGLKNAYGIGSGGAARGLGDFVQAPGEAMVSSMLNTRAALSQLGASSDEATYDAMGNVTGTQPRDPAEAQRLQSLADKSRADARGQADAAEYARRANRAAGTAGGIIGGALSDAGKRAQEVYGEQMRTESPMTVRQQQNVDDASGFVDTLKASVLNPMATAATIAQSLPDTAVGAGVGSLAARGMALALRQTAAKAGQAAFEGVWAKGPQLAAQGVDVTAAARAAQAEAFQAVIEKGTTRAAGAVGNSVEGSQSGASTAAQVKDFISQRNDDGSYRISDDQLAATNPRFVELRKTNSAAEARTLLGVELGDEASPLASLWTRAAGRLSGAAEAEGKLLANGRISGRVALQNVGKEMLEEGLQNPGEDFAAYDSKRQADGAQKFDLGGSVAQGIVGGLGQGGPMHGAGYVQGRLADAMAPTAPGATSFTEADSPSARAGLTPIVVPDAAPAAAEPATQGAAGAVTSKVSQGEYGGVSDALAKLAGEGRGQGRADPAASMEPVRPSDATAGERIGAGAPGTVAGGGGLESVSQPASGDAGTDATLKPTETWLGRSGQGYLTEKDAQQAVPGRAARNPALDWRVESVGDRFQIAGYERSAMDARAHEAATSPQNTLPEPTQAQKEAGNYKKGHLLIDGLNISIENPRGSSRSGVDKDGSPWSVTMENHYGYIKGTVGADKDHVDVIVGPHTDASHAYIVDQIHPSDGSFDEHKVVLGAQSPEQARAIYQANYAPGWRGLGGMKSMPMPQFKVWVKAGVKTKPLTQLKGVGDESARAGGAVAAPAGGAAGIGTGLEFPRLDGGPTSTGQTATVSGDASARSAEQTPGASNGRLEFPDIAGAGLAGQSPADRQAERGSGAGRDALSMAAGGVAAGPAGRSADAGRAGVGAGTAAGTSRPVAAAPVPAGLSLNLAPPAPTSQIELSLDLLHRQQGVLAKAHTGPLTGPQRISSAIARVFGKTLTFYDAATNKDGRKPSGFIADKKHIFIDAHASDGPVQVVMHEVMHGLGRERVAALVAKLRPLMQRVDEFRDRFDYTDANKHEELAAFFTQTSAVQPDFWKRVHDQLGDGDFRALARLILDKIQSLQTGFSAKHGAEFLNKYATDVVAVRDIIAAEFASAANERAADAAPEAGMQFARDEERNAPGDGFSREGEVSQNRRYEGGERKGQYVGAPTKYNTPAKIPHLRRLLAELASEGEPGKLWYERSGATIMQMVGRNRDEAHKFVALLAIYSPQSHVDANSTFALRAWAQYKAGARIAVKTGRQDQQAAEVLYDNKPWGGEKTNNFYRNLMREVDADVGAADKQGVTVDMWMMRAAGYDADVPTEAAYRFVENETNRLAAELGWEPQQVQAAIWVAMKGRTENKGVKQKTIKESGRKGYSEYVEGSKGALVLKVNDPINHRKLWLKNALALQVSDEDINGAKFDYTDGIRRHMGQISWEARPSRASGLLPGASDAPYAQQAEFQQAMAQALTGPRGQDLLAEKLGLLIDGQALAPGVWQGEIATSTQIATAMAPEVGGVPRVDAAQRKLLSAYTDVLGLVMRQDGVGWHRPFFSSAKKNHNGLDLDIGRVLTPTEAGELYNALDRTMRAQGHDGWADASAMIATGTGIRVVSFGGISNEMFRDAVTRAVESLPEEFAPKMRGFLSDGELSVNDWKGEPDGQSYRSRLSATGRSDVLGWAASVLEPAVQAVRDDFSKRYGWGDPGKRLDFSLAPAAEAGGVQEPGRVRGGSGVLAEPRRPYQGDGRKGASLVGLPARVTVDGREVEFAGFAPAQEAAQAYARTAGLPYAPPTQYAKVDKARATRIAQAFESLTHAPADPDVRASYAAMIRETMAQYDAIVKTGLVVEFNDGGDPYGNPRNAILDVVENGHLFVFSTADGFGSSSLDVSDNPLLASTKYSFAGKPALANDIFRVVHDYFGHVKDGVGFRADGEENAWRSHAAMYSPLALRAMTTETRGQNSWVNFGPHAEANQTASGGDTVYADQKVGLLPQWVSEQGAGMDFSNAPSISNVNSELVKTPTFKRWFGDSKVVDADGRPLVVYHGSDAPRESFEPAWRQLERDARPSELVGNGSIAQTYRALKAEPELHFFSEERGTAESYGEGVTEAYLSVQRPVYAADRDEAIRKMLDTDADGARFEDTTSGGGAGGMVWVVRRSTQVKSATQNSGAFDPQDARLNYSNDVSPIGFYSELARKVEGGPGRAMADQWRAYINGLTTKGVKADEIAWTGVQDWLALQTGKVSKAQVAEFLKGNGVQVHETVLGSPAPGALPTGWTVTESDEEPGLWEARDGIGVLWGDGASREAAIENSGANARTPVTNTKYQDYTLPGGTNYREVLLTLPRRAAATQFQIKNRDTGGYIGDFTSSAEASEFLRNGPRADEFAAGDFTVVARESQERGYRSSHWDQPNVLAHVRVNDRIDTDGKRVLFVEELQSDWGQTGKKDGFKTNLSADTHEVVPMRTSSRSVEPDGFGIVRIGDADQTSEDIYDTLEEANAALMRGGKSGVGVPAAPFVGKTESWLSLGLKRVIKMAVDEGYARVAFVNGEQSSERYDLSKQIDSLEYKRNPAGGGHLQAFDLDGEKVMDERLGADHELEGLVGKEVAKKILAQEPMTNFTSDKMSYVLNDAELKVGGEGMAIFYDKIVPNTARDVLKKLGGGPLVQMQLDTPSDKRARLNEKRVWSGPELSVGEVRRAAANPSVTVSVREQLDAVASAMRSGYSLAEAMQREASMSAARALGGDMVVPPGQILTQTGFDITDAMREHAGEGLPMFSNNPDPQQDYAFDLNSIKRPEPKPATRATDGWILSRDALGNFRFGAGQKLYDVVSHLAGIAAAKVGMKPMSTELRRAIRQMNLEVSRSQAKTAAVATEMAKMSPEHRAMISDIIEQELEAGVTPPAQVLHIAATISGLVSQQTDDLIAVGMLSPEAADKWRDRYLPRFYESKLKGTATDAWDKAVAMLSRKPTALKGIGGKSLKRRGMTEVVDASQVKAYQDMGWTVDDKEFDPAVHTRVQMHRDFTRPERERMGEIRDSMFRFVMGYSRAQKDLALGRLYEHLADTIGSRHELPGHVKVPDSIIDGTDVNTYGKLAGMWVPQEVLSHLTRFGEGEYEAVLKIYRKGLGMWKEGKTVLNPVSHANNVVSNLTMAHFGGVSYWDAPKYIAAMRDFVSGGGMLQEAKDAGLFGGTISEAELMSMMPKELQILSKMTESQGGKNVEFVWNAMSLFLRKTMGAAYQAEDLFFRHLLYREARNQGLHANDAVDYAQRFIFTYDDLPRGARMVRDTALPFFSYTYKVAPVLAHTALAYPWRYAAPWAAITALNTLMYAIAQGHDDDDDWKESIRKYVTDASFRDKVREKEKMERKDLPPWMKGDGFVLHTPKTVRLGMDDLTHLPVFLDISRFFPGGDLLDMNSNTGGVPWLQNLTPSSPLITTMGAMMWNRDPYFGKDIVDTNDTSYEASLKRGQWLWQQFAPAISVNNYVFNRSMNAVAQATGSTVTWWPEDFTGIGKDGLPIQPKYAAMQNIGIKARPIDLDASARMEVGQRRKMIHDIEGEIRGLQRLRSRGAVSDEQAATKIDRSREKIQRLRSGLDVNGNPKE